ncbi:MAG: MBL fold metallo-hydrolase [Bacteroidetes bacterium]|nr:MBL fold metallo-hydrolase [Bacteroidota bacterium]
MNVQLLRNASLVLKVNGKTILVDPMLADKGSYEPFMHTARAIKNPLVDLPIGEQELECLISQTDAVLLTHIHLDHWDIKAQQLLPKDILLFCQPVNAATIREQGFTNVVPVDLRTDWDELTIYRTGGQHGTGENGKRMGAVSGYIIQHGADSLYIAGDTIWCQEVQDSLDTFKPKDIIVNGGAARFITGDPIVMDIADIVTLCTYSTDAKVYVVHLEAVNHGTESRADIKNALAKHELSGQCRVPTDGEWFI